MKKYTSDDSEIIAKNKFEGEIVENNNTLKTFFSDNDKTPLWDGQLFIYKNIDKNISNWIDKLYVQIKGRNVKKITEGNKTFSLEIEKIEAYQRDLNGTLLLVCLYTDEMEYELYYRNLLPVDLKNILDNVDEGNESTSFEIYPIKKGKKNAILNICLNFTKNAKKQINTEIKDIEDIENIKEIKANYIGNSQDEFYNELLDNKIYTYAIDKDDKTFAISKYNNIKIFMGQRINKNVSIDDRIYYNSYILQRQKKELSIIIDNCITIDLNKHKIHYSFKGNINQRIKSLKFFIDMQNKKKITINGITMNLKEENINLEKYEKELNKLIEIDNMFEKLGVDFKEKIEDLDETDWRNINILVNIFEKNKKPEKPLIEQTGLCKIPIGNIVILLFVNVEKNNYYNFFEDLSNFEFFAKKEDGKEPTEENRISPYLLLVNKKIMGDSKNLLDYANWNSEIVKKSFEKIARYKDLSEYINEFILRLITTFDVNKDENKIDLAMYLCEQLLKQNYENEIDKYIYTINYFQIVKRKREYTKNEIDELYGLKEIIYNNDKCMLKCCIAILLDIPNDFNYYFDKLNEKDKEIFKNFPIYYLKNKQ